MIRRLSIGIVLALGAAAPAVAQDEFKIQRGVTTVPSASLTVTLTAPANFTAVSSTSSAFVRITNSQHTGAGLDSGGGDQNADDVTCHITLDTTSQVTITRFGSATNTRVAWEIVEYIGPPSGPNEIVVLEQGVHTFTGTNETETEAFTGDADGNANDLVGFVTGVGNPDTGRTNYDAQLVTTEFDDASTLRFRRRTDNSVAIAVSYAVVEFTGSNWAIQRVEHTYTAKNSIQTETITAVNDLERAFLHVQKRVQDQNNIADHGHEVWFSSTTAVSFRISGDSGISGRSTSVAWVIENTAQTGNIMTVTRANGTLAASGPEPDTDSISYGPVSDLGVTSIFWNNDCDEKNSSYPRPMVAVRLTSTSNIEAWRSDTGSSQRYRYEIVEWPRFVAGRASDFKIQQGCNDIPSGSSTVTLTAPADFDAVSSTSSAFVRITNSQHTGAGKTSGGGIMQNADDVTSRITLDTTSQITITRFGSPAGGRNTRVCWEIVEYTGPSGGDNEIIVRKQGVHTFASTGTNETETLTGVSDVNDLVGFVTGVASPDTTNNDYLPSLVTMEFDNATTVRFKRGTAGSDAVAVSYAVVEFTGTNWKIQRVEHTYSAVDTTETETITAVNSLTRAFLHTQKRNSGGNPAPAYGHQVWLSATNQVSFQIDVDADPASGNVSVAWVIENTQTDCTPMNVIRGSGQLALGGAEPETNNISYGPVTDLASTSIFWNNSANDLAGDDAFPVPMVAVRLTSTSNIEAWQSDTGADVDYRYEVVEWPGSGRDIGGTIYTNEAKTTNVGAGKTVALSVNGGAPTTVETVAGGAFTFSEHCFDQSNTILLYLENETENASLVTVSSGLTALTGLEMYTDKIVLRNDAGASIDNQDLDLIDTVDAEDEDGITIAGGVATFASSFELWIESGHTYQPLLGVTAADIEIKGTFDPQANSVTVTGNWDNDGTASSTGTVTFSGSADQFIGGTAVTTFSTLTIANTGDVSTIEVTLNNVGAGDDMTVTTLNINDGKFAVGSSASVTPSGTVTVQTAADATLEVGSSATLTISGTLRLLGSSGVRPSLLCEDSGSSVVVNGTFEVSYVDLKPRVAKTTGGTGTFTFQVLGTLNVNGLEFGDAGSSGFEIGDGVTTVTLTRFENVRFERAVSGGRHLTINDPGPLTIDAPDCYFDSTFGASPPGYNVSVNDTNAVDDVTIVLEDRDDTQNGPGRGEAKDNDVSGGVAAWIWSDSELGGAGKGIVSSAYVLNTGLQIGAYATFRDVNGTTNDRVYFLDSYGEEDSTYSPA